MTESDFKAAENSPAQDEKIRVVFMGSSDFAVAALQALARDDRYLITLAAVQPDRPNSRGKKIVPLPVKKAAEELGIPVYQPEHISAEGEALLKSQNADLFIVCAYGQILKQNILDIPKYGCLNIHGSLLPHLRGAAPVHRAILAGDKRSGVTIMKLDAGMDTGDMLSKAETEITETTTVGELHDRLADLGAELLIRTIPEYIEGKITPVPQDEALADYADKIEKSEGCIDWSRTSEEIIRRINATDPFPGAFTTISDHDKLKKMKVFTPSACTSAGEPDLQPGTVVNADQKGGLVIKTGDGSVQIGEVQMPGRKRMKTSDYFKGNSIATGTILGAQQA
ncbi:MAG: methionyl-tRNA formyltransferase [Eubacteriaceae bacterium]|jgi:methionyl-tRNA formyltransferase